MASALETEILPARIENYQPWDLDALCASGEVGWAGLEPLGATDGRVALYLPANEALLARPSPQVEGALARAIRGVLARRGAVFFGDIAREVGGFPNAVLDTVWQMVWAGEVTNDSLEPLRSRAQALASDAQRRQHPRHARAVRTGPAGSEGRWSLRASRWGDPGARAPSETDRRAALAKALLDRYGVVTREGAHAEGISGGFAAVYDVLKALEEQGRVRRGYFVEGRGGAQFALPGAEERLRAMRNPREDAPVVVLAATDPANPWGALVEWPASRGEARPQRAAGALVVVRDGELLGWLGRGEHPLLAFVPEHEPARTRDALALASALGGLVERGLRRALLISTVDGEPAAASPLAPVFVRAGFAPTLHGLFKRAPAPQPAGDVASPRRSPRPDEPPPDAPRRHLPRISDLRDPTQARELLAARHRRRSLDRDLRRPAPLPDAVPHCPFRQALCPRRVGTHG